MYTGNLANMTMLIKIKVQPNAKKNEICGTLADGILKIKITAPALEGKANAKLIEFLSGEYGVSKSQIEITKGAKSNIKTIKISR
ncbi:MAG: YggU family protein [Candidatus Magasanikbacteria bacterium RIFOXYB2_FULL_38_10]|nr:MAG: YggU family protein [Candidatus Magasanikbacteria bacterium RIFOXYB2_FULL_38_10]